MNIDIERIRIPTASSLARQWNSCGTLKGRCCFTIEVASTAAALWQASGAEQDSIPNCCMAQCSKTWT